MKSAVGADAFVDIVIEQASELFVEYNESIVDADTVLAAVDTVACANTTSTSCVATFPVQRRRALARTVAITITRALAGSERVKSVPSVSAVDLAAALGVDVSAIGSVKPPSIKSVRIVIVLDTTEEQDKTQLLGASALIFGIDSSTLTLTVTSQFPPSLPSPVAPSEPGTNVTARIDNEAGNPPPAWLFVVIGVAAALLAVLACVYCYCRKRRGVSVQATNKQSSYVEYPTYVSVFPPDVPSSEVVFRPEIPSAEQMSTPESPSAEQVSTPESPSAERMSTPEVSALPGSGIASMVPDRTRIDPTASEVPALLAPTSTV